MQLIPMILTVFLILSLMLATMQKISVQHTCITHRVMDHLAIESKLSEVAANQFFEKALSSAPDLNRDFFPLLNNG
ncbi:MAG: hypothetical protein EB053_06125 [Chlamydiae bacterium]|nr:hypothetical protein [Chlamydiota bacterium]